MKTQKTKIELDFIKQFCLYLSVLSGGITNEEINEQIEEINNNQKKDKMYNWVEDLLETGEKKGIEKGIEIGNEQGIEKGIEKGIEIGNQQGRERGKIMTIFDSYEQGCSVELLVRIYVMPVEAILFIIEAMKKVKDENKGFKDAVLDEISKKVHENFAVQEKR